MINEQIRGSMQTNISNQLEDIFEKASHLHDEKQSDSNAAQQSYLEEVMFNFLTGLS